MSVTYVNWTSRVAIAGRVAETRRQFHSSNESTIQATTTCRSAKSKHGPKHSSGFGTPRPDHGATQLNISEQRTNAMTTKTILDRSEEELFINNVSDEALEIAAGSAKEKANFTLGACSGLSVCPG